MLYAERHRPRGVGLAGAVHRTWAVAEKNDWQFSNPRIDTACTRNKIQGIRGGKVGAVSYNPRSGRALAKLTI